MTRYIGLAAAMAAGLTACINRPGSPVPPAGELSRAESLYADLRSIRDKIDVSIESGPSAGVRLPRLIQVHNDLRKRVASSLAAVDSTALTPDDVRALGTMRRALDSSLDHVGMPIVSAADSAPQQPECDYDAGTVAARRNGLDSLRKRIYACYSWAQSHVVVEGDTMDRLTVLGLLGRTNSSDRRRGLFLALTPVWRSVNGDNGTLSPYRRLIAEEIAARRGTHSAAEQQAEASGVPPDSLEKWLLRVLDTWRSVTPDSSLEPWDWYYETGRASRRLSPRISKPRLTVLNTSVYQSLGADVDSLGVHFDLEPRPGKTPVAFCTFGDRPRLIDGTWRGGEPWIFATYGTGGLDNLNELLHETGHAVHIAAIRTRPAFADWPDSDPFTEALAELAALDVYEPAWQQRWLGDSVPTPDGIRSRYGGIVLDVAWALFELRMLRDRSLDPNQVWTSITQEYLRIRPHPELSWWAMRGQLVNAPGYMMNYAVGAVLAADLRARARTLRGSTARDAAWYSWIAPRLFRFGLERPARQVIETFLGRAPSPAAILEDMARMAQ